MHTSRAPPSCALEHREKEKKMEKMSRRILILSHIFAVTKHPLSVKTKGEKDTLESTQTPWQIKCVYSHVNAAGIFNLTTIVHAFAQIPRNIKTKRLYCTNFLWKGKDHVCIHCDAVSPDF